jgi:D-arabinose 1-dehydrogenase-like Zn-dependent alcohol dehydrogenase
MLVGTRLLLAFFLSTAGFAQYAVVLPAQAVELPKVIDGNTAAMWADGQLHIFHSTGVPAGEHRAGAV